MNQKHNISQYEIVDIFTTIETDMLNRWLLFRLE